MIARTKDSESDVYSFQAPGIGGKFSFDETGAPRLIPEQDLEISNVIGGANFLSFTITNQEGTKYIFGSSSGPTAYGSSSIDQVFPMYTRSEWFLKRIESFDGSSFMTFDYADEEYSSKVTPSRYYFAPAGYGETSSLRDDDLLNIRTKRLTKITTQSEVIDFIATNKREDLTSGSTTEARQLDKVRVTSGGYVMEWELLYDYFKASSSTVLPEEKRLRLLSVQKKAMDNSDAEGAYVFDYKKSGSDYFLPNRTSRSRDYWGYYNGKNNDSYSLNIPSFTLAGISNPVSGADRSSDSTKMDIGVLTSVTYPTGGIMSLDYQTNRFKPIMGCPVPPIVSTTTQFTGQSETSCINPMGNDDCCGTQSVDLTVNFTNSDDIIYGFAEIMAIKDLGNNTGGCSTPLNASATLIILNSNNDVIATRILNLNDDIAAAENDPSYPNIEVSEEITLAFNILDIQPGQDYTFRISSENAFGQVRIMRNVAVPDAPNGQFLVGGLRISEITQDKGDGNNNIVTRYQYSDGTLLEPYPEFATYINSQFSCPAGGCNGQTGFYYIRGVYFSENSSVPLSDLSGEHMGYQKVVQRVGTGNGRTEYNYNIEQFTQPPFSPPNASTFPGAKPQVNLANNGLTTSVEIFAEGSTTPVSSSSSTYNITDLYDDFGESAWSQTALFTLDGLRSEFILKYKTRTKPVLLLANTQALDGVSTITSYTYDPMNRFLPPVSETMTNSDGNAYTTEYMYPHDKPGNVYSAMVDQNRITPVETIQKENTIQIDGTRTNCSFITSAGVPTINNTGIGPFPQTYDRYERTWDIYGNIQPGAWVLQATIDKYDPTALRPSEVTIDGWEKETLTWNSNGTIDNTSFENYVTDYEYFGNSRLLRTMTNPDGTSSSYTYDELLRLKTTTDDNRNVVTTYDYIYGNPTTGGNKVVSSTDYPSISNSALDIIENITFIDGLGRPFQTNRKNQSTTNSDDVVSSVAYDDQGRLKCEYEAISSTGNGAFVPISSSNPRTFTIYEPDPLSRKFQVNDPIFNNTFYVYRRNLSNDVPGYAANTLFKHTYIDPDLRTTITYTDKKGRTIAKEISQDGKSGKLLTVHEYDGKDRVSKINPPGSGSDNGLKFRYEYFGNDLVKNKFLPDQDRIEYRYNERDLMTAYQDGNMRSDNQWMSYNFDPFGRQVRMGFISAPNANNSSTDPTITAVNLLQENIYNTATTGIYTGKMDSEKCQPLDATGLSGITITKNYDYEAGIGRLKEIKTNSLINQAIDNEVTTFVYDGADNVTITGYDNIVDGVSLSIDKRMTYDHAGRADAVYHDFNGAGEVQISEQTYTVKDQLLSLELGGGLQELNYTYLNNQWLDKINDPLTSGADLFHLDLLYNETVPGISVDPLRNGDISNIISQVKGSDRMVTGYEYDFADRLVNSKTGYLNGSGTLYDTDKFNTAYDYDPRGNITTMERKGQVIQNDAYSSQMIDDLAYTYYTSTNRLKSISDNAVAQFRDRGVRFMENGDYLYDDNGNITHDPTKEVTLKYNYINLPVEADFGSGDRIEWTYTPQGEQLKKVILRDDLLEEVRFYLNGNEYIDSMLVQVNHEQGRIARSVECQQIQYVTGLHQDNEAISGKTIISDAVVPENAIVDYHAPQKVLVPETFDLGNNGLLTIDTDCTDGAWQYEYVIRDHLGSTRVMFADIDGNSSIDENTEILSVNHYYPFGMEMDGQWQSRGEKFDYAYGYNGKELNKALDLGW